jgi:hypothetical protein
MSSTDLQQSTGSAASPLTTAPMTKSIQRDAKQALDRVTANTLIALQIERGRAALTDEALHNAGALTALEEHLIKIAPLGQARYQAIVDSYALGAAEAVTRWGR